MKTKERKFKILRNPNLKSLNAEVQNLIKGGWEKSGILEEKNGIYIQKMIKKST